jgi:hypothetical protein
VTVAVSADFTDVLLDVWELLVEVVAVFNIVVLSAFILLLATTGALVDCVFSCNAAAFNVVVIGFVHAGAAMDGTGFVS